MSAPFAAIDHPAMRRASREQLSLALMDARNHTLQLLARFEHALGETLRTPMAPETTLELLEHTPDEDDALYFFRMALFHEDLRGEELVNIAQTLGVPLSLALPPGVGTRPPLLLPATRCTLGWPEGEGFALDIE